MKKFCVRLRELRQKKGLSAKSLGDIIGVSDVSILNWENNITDIKSEYVIKLAQFFCVTTDYLLGVE